MSDLFDSLPYGEVSEYVRREPFASLAIAAATGFVLGGGVNGRIGLAILTFVGRKALRGVATSLIVGIMAGGPDDLSREGAPQDRENYDLVLPRDEWT